MHTYLHGSRCFLRSREWNYQARTHRARGGGAGRMDEQAGQTMLLLAVLTQNQQPAGNAFNLLQEPGPPAATARGSWGTVVVGRLFLR